MHGRWGRNGGKEQPCTAQKIRLITLGQPDRTPESR